MADKNTLRLTDNKKTALLLSAVILGVLLIAAAGFIGKAMPKANVPDDDRLSEYIADMEARLCKVVSGIDGAGSTEVFITVENTFETVYANNATLDESGDETKSTKTTQKQLAYTTTKESGEAPVVIKQLCPKICGVLIVCEGGGNSNVRTEILNSVSTAVGIPTTKIYVTGGFH